jgi:hypothetical protein
MGTIPEGVYWCARDLKGIAVVGNHHFIMLVTDQEKFSDLVFLPSEEQGVFFCTLAAFKSDNSGLIFRSNDETDIYSVLEKINPEQYTSPLTPDLDLENHKVIPLNSSDLSFIKLVSRLAINYDNNTENEAPQYTLLDSNCSAWVNTLFAVAGIGEEDRNLYGEFFGIDLGEEDLIDQSLFKI